MPLIVCFTWLLLFCHEAEPAVTAFGSLKPSNPTFVREWENITLKWNYTIDGSVGSAKFSNATDDTTIAVKFGDGDVSVASEYQERFRADISSTLAQLTILTVQRSDSGRYKFLLISSKVVTISDEVELKVQYPADITIISGNQTVNDTDVVELNCSAEGMPPPSINWTRVSDNSPVSFPLTITGKQDEGGYRCTADNGIGNPGSQVVYIVVESYHPLDTNLSTSLAGKTVLVNTSFNITCSSDANPPARHLFYKDQDNFVNDTSGSDVSVITTSVSERIKQVNYSCTPFNDFGYGPTEELTLTVLYAPGATTLTTVPSNRTVLRDSIMSLKCETNASPEAEYHFYFNGESVGKKTTGVLSVTVEEDGAYTCVPINTVSTGDNATVTITVVVAPSVENLNETAIVVEGEDILLICYGSGKPQPVTTWTKLGSSDVLSDTSSLTIMNVSRPGTPDNMIQYKCTASNGVEKPASATSTIDVHYAPSFINPGNETINKTIELGQEVTFLCVGIGNPAPTVNWTSKDNEIMWMSNLTNVTFKPESYSSGSYLCTIKNELGEASKRYDLVLEGQKFLIKVTVTNKNCDNDNPSEICQKARETVKEEIDAEFKGRLKSVTEEYCGCGSVTAYLSLDFTQSVKIPDVLSVLKKAAEGNAFGDLQVDPGSIQAISDDQLPTDSTTQGPSVGTTTSGGDKDNGKLWIIIGASVGGAIVLVVAVVACCVHHKRKCRRKGSKVRCSESEEQTFAPREGIDHGHANNGYAEAGPRSTAMVDMSQHQGASAVPTYAVVDKSAKKESKKDKEVEEQKPQAEPPQYSVVDKSKKKKKKEQEATYAQVDMSKKSKKKPKPGEVLYADLGDFQQMQELPKVSTSPQPLPPIKRPEAYTETQYADITQFLKGDVTLPDSNYSQGPATGTQASPVPENSNSQEAVTSTKETSQAGNPGGDGGPVTNF